MNKLGKLLISIAGPLLIGFGGSLFTIDAIPTWYAQLHKPFFSPPNWLFGPVWTVLYVLMGIACYVVWQNTPSKKRTQALYYFLIQLVLNALWTPLFFGAKLPGLALLEILVLWIFILLTTIQFYRLKHIAGYLLIPYLLWVSFATALNAAIVWLN